MVIRPCSERPRGAEMGVRHGSGWVVRNRSKEFESWEETRGKLVGSISRFV